VNEPAEWFLQLPEGRLRVLTFGDGKEAVVFLHGLSGVADVWRPTVAHLPSGRRYLAIDQRGHGQSFAPETGYTAAAMATDVEQAIAAFGSPVHLVGHSMGARIAIVLAARRPHLLRSVAVVDIGPEASKANIESTVRGVLSRPERFANRDEAVSFAFRNREPTEQDVRIFLARLAPATDGGLTWRSPAPALCDVVTRQRSKSYWREWRSIRVPALFIHGGASNEVSVAIADRMRQENPSVAFERFEGVGHNIPLIAPDKLAATLEKFWTTAAKSAT
jgi:2-(acetamidomethylene)succinate hydrolase